MNSCYYEEPGKFKSESVWCNLLVGHNHDVCVGVCYKSPAANDEEVKELFSAIKLVANKQTLIMGDFNYPNINWDLLQSDSNGHDFLNLVQDCFLVQHVLEPTRENNVLDLVFSSEESMVENVKVREHFSSSDHNVITWTLNCKTVLAKNHSSSTRYDYSKADFGQINTFLKSIDWESKFSNKDANEVWETFSEILKSTVHTFAPESKSKSKVYPMWMTKAAKRAQKYKSKMWKRYKQNSSYNNLMEYRKARNLTTQEYKNSKTNFESKLTKNIKNDSKSFYAYVRSKAKTKDRVGPLSNDSGDIITDDSSMSRIFNEYFASVFTDESLHPRLPPIQNMFKEDDSEMLLDIYVTEDMVLKKLKGLKANKAPGVDNIVPKILIETAEYICEPLCLLFNESLVTGVVPREWKQANVSVIFKKGSKKSPSNYRPISLTCQVCKVLESIIKDSIVLHLSEFKLINKSQHGFTRNRSCLTNLLEYLTSVCDSVDKGMPVDVIYLDFQKAFDKVPHKRLMLKVCAHGIQGRISCWIENWLRDREQRVVLNGCSSEWTKVLSGVPQGSVLGPLMFVLYINDIDERIMSKLSKFADDTKVFREVSSVDDVNKLRSDLITLFKWSEEWLMLFNVEKCKVLHIGHRNTNQDYTLGSCVLESVSSERDLGVIIQNDLKVSEQCSKVVKTANKILGMINRTFTFKTKDNMLQLYKSLVRPHVEYCIQAWRPHLVKDIALIENVQHRATRMIPSLRGLSYEQRLEKLNLTTLELRRLRGDLIEVFKIINGFEDLDVSNYFSFAHSNLRGHSYKLFKSRFSTNIGKFAFVNRVVDEWNKLPIDVVSSNTVLNFKINLDVYLRNGWGLT